MINRRTLITGATCFLAVELEPCHLLADDVTAPTATVVEPVLMPTEQLLYSTVRLAYKPTPTTVKWGTAFFFAFFKTEAVSLIALVTNRHVVEDMKSCFFSLVGRTAEGKPDTSTSVPVSIDPLEGAWLAHPSADLAIIPITQILSRLKPKPFFVTLDQTHILADAQLKELLPVEQVLSVGFPGALWDDVHNLPVFHRGYTATAPYIDFKGQKEFLIDFTTWPGASGSPVLLYNEGSWLTRKGTVMGGVRASLLGIVYGVATQDVSGNVVIQNGPTSIAASGSMSVPTNLGACIMASQILDFEPLLVSKGVVPPAGYKMRAN